MIKKLIAASVFAVTLSSSAQAQGLVPGTGNCLLSDGIFQQNALACYGFFAGNSNIGDAGNAVTGDAATAIDILMGSSAGVTILEKANWAGTSPFATPLYGITIIGMHWGNYADAEVAPLTYKNVSAFYKFDFGSTGTTNFPLTRLQGISNYAIYSTGTQVPEPASFALVAAGVLGLSGVARRRKSV
ncbi:MAG: PEP-CTERM sorting domain-containing protein [Gemmatimonadota bacterium]|nr:PEP-CTERM sorting domain-containing protein [Gemmatimonadota bacterium]